MQAVKSNGPPLVELFKRLQPQNELVSINATLSIDNSLFRYEFLFTTSLDLFFFLSEKKCKKYTLMVLVNQKILQRCAFIFHLEMMGIAITIASIRR